MSGSAEVKVVPDQAFLSVGVETRHESLEKARQQNDESISKALRFLKDNNVEEKNVQTDFINVEPTFDNNVSRTWLTYSTDYLHCITGPALAKGGSGCPGENQQFGEEVWDAVGTRPYQLHSSISPTDFTRLIGKLRKNLLPLRIVWRTQIRFGRVAIA